jgi:hypothetical protein
MQCQFNFRILILSSLMVGLMFLPYSKTTQSFTTEEEAILNKAQKSLNAHKLQENSSQIESGKVTDSSIPADYKKYENTTYGVGVKYPKDWRYQGTSHDKNYPDKIFQVYFFSPTVNSQLVLLSISIEKLSPQTSLEKYKNRILGNMKDNPDTKDITVSKDTLAAQPAYRIEDMSFFTDHWEKGISIYSVIKGKFYEVDVLAEPEQVQEHSEDIQSMIKSVQFEEPTTTEPTATPEPGTSESTTIEPTTAPERITISPSETTPPTSNLNSCDTSYPDFCIPSPPPNLNCPDIPQKNFKVLPPDPHGFDRDRDGVGCET